MLLIYCICIYFFHLSSNSCVWYCIGRNHRTIDTRSWKISFCLFGWPEAGTPMASTKASYIGTKEDSSRMEVFFIFCMYMYVCMYVCMFSKVWIDIALCMLICEYTDRMYTTYTCIHTYIYTPPLIKVYIHTYINTYIHTYVIRSYLVLVESFRRTCSRFVQNQENFCH